MPAISLMRYGLALFTIVLLVSGFTSSEGNETNEKHLSSPKTITVTPSVRHQQFEGWGGSLCWWAHIMGAYSTEKVDSICNWITHPTEGLNMNLFRFNIGGGDAPGHNHMRTDGGDMPGYKASATSAYDWKSDAAQRKILQQLIASRIANTGKNDIQIVAFSNSPPWWMTVSGCVAGSVNGNTTNLKPEMFDDFADYLTEVTKYYHDSLGITFDHLEPFNEPYSTWWTANKVNGQEGCYFSQPDQERMIRELYRSLQQKNMLQYCKIAVMDANSIDEAYPGLLKYKAAGDILPLIDRIDIHSYFGNQRREVRNFAHENKIKLWQSESGPLNVGGSNEHQLMVVAQRIVTDIQEMGCTAWLDWQLANDHSPLWGMLVGKYNHPEKPVEKGPSFYLRAQFSRYLKQNYYIIATSSANALAAISPDEKEIVLIVVNTEIKKQNYSIDLSQIEYKNPVSHIVTSIQHNQQVFLKSNTLNASGHILSVSALPLSVNTIIFHK